ncbi:hypothetical protein QS257_10400 [Terrilactibacillus sp. S3-3]|nr:hypothetical protein QS257_10400 [Terrilactibacillus sp. S3-3]
MEDPIRWLEFGLGILIFLIVWFSAMHFNTVKKILIGRPMRTEELHNKANKLFWWMALPILSADMYSSVAYAPESGIRSLRVWGRMQSG